MDDSSLSPALEVLDAAIERGDISGAVALVLWKGDIILHSSLGAASIEPTLSGGQSLSSRAFGHNGFTGTSIWIDPELDLVAVLLTNRTHPVAGDRDTISTIRGDFHDAVSTLVSGEGHGAYVAEYA